MGPTRSLALASAWIAPNAVGVEPAQFVLHLLQVPTYVKKLLRKFQLTYLLTCYLTLVAHHYRIHTVP